LYEEISAVECLLQLKKIGKNSSAASMTKPAGVCIHEFAIIIHKQIDETQKKTRYAETR
jgi:hypothetical protein